ncbi:AAA family ATPase [Kitasatospora indigofera]|uniref:AAA family ATPase n=1 Tax=Kitasatospora indigofera TaxID=67307 RepID=UPI0033BA89B7
MKIHSIAARDFLSFASLDLPLKAGTTIVTGPNGAGKSNLGAAVALPLAVLEYGLRGPAEDPDPMVVYEQAGRDGADAYSVSLGIELDQPWEQELARLFVEAVVNATAIESVSTQGTDRGDKEALAAFSQLGIAADSVSCLYRGTLRVAFSARYQQRWWASWDFKHGGEDFQLILKGSGAGQLLRGRFYPWQDVLTSFQRSASPLLGYERPRDGETQQDVLLSFLRSNGSPKGEGRLYKVDFDRILMSLDETRAFTMAVPVHTSGSVVEPASLGALARALGRRPQDRTMFDFRFVLAEVLRRGLVLTDNRRLPLERRVQLSELSRPVSLRDGSAVAAELYRLKNGNWAEQVRFEQVRSLFKDISQLDLHLRSLPTGDEHLAIDILVGEGGGRIAQFSGAGIQEALLLATLLAGEPGRVVVLDEPAVNLHPTMQRRLTRYLAEAPGIVITHSPDLVPCSGIEDLDRVVRLTSHPDGTRVSVLAVDRRGQLADWMQRLLLTDVRALLFASGVVLCEGATELGALSQWWKDGAAAFSDPEGDNITMIDVGGDYGFGGYINYLEAFGIPWTVVADGPASRLRGKLGRQLSAMGLAPATEAPGDDDGFEASLAYWNLAGVFSLADTFGDDGHKAGEIEAYLGRLDAGLLAKVSQEHRNSKPRVGAAFAASHPAVPTEVVELYRQIREHLGGRTR